MFERKILIIIFEREDEDDRRCDVNILTTGCQSYEKMKQTKQKRKGKNGCNDKAKPLDEM